jgi:multicomponent Na+:H+ antiporter subunit F
MTVVAAIAAVFLAAPAGMALVRIIRGPSTLDRIVGTDVLLAITVCAIATEAAYSRDATGLPILLGLSLLGAAGSVAVARFADPVARAEVARSPAAPSAPDRPGIPRSAGDQEPAPEVRG